MALVRSTRFLALFFWFVCLLASVNFAKADAIQKAGDDVRDLLQLAAIASTFVADDVSEGLPQYLKAHIAATLVTKTLKRTTRKLRPDGSNRQSFPSGHTKAAFVGAAFIHRRYGFDHAIPAYVAASFVGYSRVHARKHYPIDVFAGAALGVASVFLFVEPTNRSWVRPDLTRQAVGLEFGVKF